MRTATLDDFMALNDQLAALLQAGVPIDAGLARSTQESLAQLQQINAGVARRVAQGAALEAALEQEDVATAAYRGMMQVGLRSGNLPAALAGQSHLAQAVQGTQEAVWRGLLYPLIVCALAYAGFVGMCLFFVPVLEELHATLRMTPDWSLRLLAALRETLPMWVAVPPAVLLLVLLWHRIASRRASFSGGAALPRFWLPGLARAIYWQRCANLADRLATLLEAGVPLQQGLALTARAAGDASLIRGADQYFASGSFAAPPLIVEANLPSLLRWVLFHSASTGGSGSSSSPALRMAARWYRSAAGRRADQIRLAAPLLACIVIGGTATLLYGLALFVPLIHLYRQLAVS
jgi:general secretion pathway protein F